ncbi:unnamed protein product, partial [Prorocentrum cordatum]
MPRRDNCMLFQSFDPKSRTAPPPLPRSQLDGATREHTHKFREFRREFQEGRIALDGPRVGQLRQLLRDNDAQGLQRFLDAKRGSVVQLQPGQTCRWCNRRVAEAGAAGRPPARGRRAEGPGAPRLCQICREWHCAEHCNCLSRIVSGRYVLDITCCRQCSVFLDVQRWHREGRQALNKADDTTIGACLWVLADADAMLSACREVGLTHAPPRKVAGEAVIVKAIDTRSDIVECHVPLLAEGFRFAARALVKEPCREAPRQTAVGRFPVPACAAAAAAAAPPLLPPSS